ncbi:uncharacterized protein LOC122504320 isoform X2 [Leptopilina heterotoma]|nr:uncharacterized protein LOC122504320 isoform X2 [Leptopilina heterotoma]
MGEVSQKCPNITSDVLVRISKGISCSLSRYENINRTLIMNSISEDAANDIANVLENKKIYNLSPVYSDQCLSQIYNFDLNIFNNSGKYLSFNQTELYTNISNALIEANEGISNENLSSYVVANILKILNNIPDNVRQNIFNITFQVVKKCHLNSQWQIGTCAIEISQKIMDLIGKSQIPLNYVSPSYTKIETSIQTSDVYQLYVNLFEFLENYESEFILEALLSVQIVIKNTLQDKIPKIKTNSSLKRNIFNIASYIVQCFKKGNSKINALCALYVTKNIINATKVFTNYQKTEMNDLREFAFVNLISYEIINVTNFIFNFIAVTEKLFFEKYEKRMENIIYGILIEYNNSTNIKNNFKVILDRLHNAEEETLSNIYILSNLELYLNKFLIGNTSSLQLSYLIMRNNLMSKLPLDFQEIQILQLQTTFFHILLEHNYDCNNFNATNLINDILITTECFLNSKQSLGIENQDAITILNINITAIEQNLTSILIESMKQNYYDQMNSIDRVTQNVLRSIGFEKFICTNIKKPTIAMFESYLFNVIKQEILQFFPSEGKGNIFNLEFVIIKLLLLEYSKCIYEKGYNLMIGNDLYHVRADWHCLEK